ncbi:hypothetical protein BD780_000623 [Clostridium tetanomorphum]|uniref:Uncharacterized protein n=1 Tax=Clostridium tetanomorphum TaxID=1553 RepID=A0A923E6X4_CLOTT|nr:hypothetical protein [Clostridium tetanomorphum]KAJ51770.1 Hypothetical protein CTM_10898 [Clostridium tetanomorphum DSM 665]MBC2397652.1 hypothetical protein [Clostridium tetanomorphum]MBP1865005.1 hypothetical protein [Clostridium tetanomorphum]NRS83398.1 hypothetical protein [Clostridium tetanomorphum]NRZ96597.1 hypothetical protein [Clostridium tetanomorphum]
MKIDKVEVFGWEAAIRGMRNPMNSWNKSDSKYYNNHVEIGANDLKLMQRLILAGTEHCKFMRYITVYMDIEAPLYWWKEFDTYKFCEKNSTSTMHKITSRALTYDDFDFDFESEYRSNIINTLNNIIDKYNSVENASEKEKNFRMIIQDLPSAFKQTRTVVTNYAELRNMYFQRKNHKLKEWREVFIDLLKSLPYKEDLIMIK